MQDAVIVDAVRTASGRGKPNGALAHVHPVNLLAAVLKDLIARNGIDVNEIDDVIAGCVTQAGDQSVNIARSAALTAGLPECVPATTVDRQCGSSQQALHFAAQSVIAGAYDVVIACGVESMSRVPMGTNVAGGDPFGPLGRRYPGGLPNQGVAAELIASRWKMSRAQLDEFAARSHELAADAESAGWFDSEVTPVTVPAADGDQEAMVHRRDQTVRKTDATSLGSLQPSFYSEELATRFPEIGWHITAGNSSPLTDGAAAALILSRSAAQRLGMRPRARFHSFAVVGSDPVLMLTGPIPATGKILARAGLSVADIDTFEVNEAFAPVPLAWLSEFDADPGRLNPCGGAIALGHPLGASGVRLMTTMLGHLERSEGRYGLQVMCEGGGMANATIIERLA